MTEDQAAALWRAETGRTPRAVSRFSTGNFNTVFLVEDEGQSFVLRFAPPGQREALKGAQFWLPALSQLDLPVPRIVSARPDAPEPFLVLTYLPGRDLGHVHDELSPEQLRAIARAVVECQRRVAALRRANRYGYLTSFDDARGQPSWAAVVQAHLERSRSRIRANGHFDPGLVDKIESLLPRFRAALAVEPAAFFDDATTKNVLVHEGRFSGLVDVDWLCFGDRLYTVALTRMSLLSARRPLDYIGFLLEDEAPTAEQLRTLDYYTLVFCADFLSELGMRFNQAVPPPVDPVHAQHLLSLYDHLLTKVE
jgi:aminoglycoside phosphotransferase (APT) family kinase protein